jgi:hypothetical protein
VSKYLPSKHRFIVSTRDSSSAAVSEVKLTVVTLRENEEET